MSTVEKRREKIVALTTGAVLTALVILLQFLGAFIRFGVFQVSLVLVPIVIGSALCNVKVSAWLGFVFAVIVLINGDAAPFMSINMIGTIITVIAKGVLCGLCAGLVYKALKNKNQFLAVMAATVVCPIVNTGVFLIGCAVFFLEGISAWGFSEGYNNVVTYMFLGLAGGNFIFELVVNLILGPSVVTLLKTLKKRG